MKVVINKCFGGFDPSNEAFKRLIEKGWTVSNINDDKETDILFNPDGFFGSNYSFNFDRDNEKLRSNKDLVEVVEELGDKASGKFGELKVVEIPDDVDFEIKEYDGLEHIAEVHRTWG
ncbi:hypothetical protein PD280_21570 [Virgibacillus salarius]|uniref:hypothetical protein n=1 Tax=Virgibacillus salarius TaxID=447199 RepID=UPI002492B870|nr:hypothetical protein [Virgibacillus salarius]WBX80155.1 hypothetical protein PD280_21570 [Virgibacillus salarius]